MSEMALRRELVDCISQFSTRGWVPATSSNFSARLSSDCLLVSRSGVDKAGFEAQDLIAVDLDGTVVQPAGARSSAETLIHCALYKHHPEVSCVLHTHSVHGAVMSRRFAAIGMIEFTGYEIQKALSGISSHLSTVSLPIVPNSQDMKQLTERLQLGSSEYRHGFLIEGHGLYTWGKDVASAKRAVEAFEFLLECSMLEGKGI